MSVAEIEAVNIGPVSRITIPVPESGGVVIFKGSNGVGKSTMLNAIDAAISGKGTVPIRDGQLRGEFTGLGVRMTIGRSTRRSGEAEVHTLEGRLSIADLVDPGIKDAEKADALRIKALVALAGAKADPSLFWDLAGGKDTFETIVQPGDIERDDLIAMTGRIKRRLESAARTAEGQAEHAEGRAKANRDAAGDVDTSAEANAQKLQDALETAIRAESGLIGQSKERSEVIRNAQAARDYLEDAEAEYDGLSVDAAQSVLAKADKEFAEATAELSAAKKRYDDAVATHALAVTSLEAAEGHAKTVTAWRQQIESAANVQPISRDDLDVAAATTKAAREALERGALIREARSKLAKAEQDTADAANHRKQAERLREAAKGTDDVLSAVVAKSGVPLRVEPVDGRMRLVTDTKARGRTCFGELSDGERWRMALDLAIKAVGEGGEITLPQAAWQDLDPLNKQAIAEQARDGGIIIYTAEADEGELRAEVYDQSRHDSITALEQEAL